MVNNPKFPLGEGEGEVKARFRLNGPDIADREIVVGRQGLRAGRSNDNTLALNHREISRQHLRIIWRDDFYFVEDLNSSNGTFLNEEELKGRDPQALKEGDFIRFGPFLLTLVSFFEEQRPVDPAQPVSATGAHANGKVYPPGIPRGKSTWLKYLPAIYEDDEFIGRYLLIFESLLSPITWAIDNFDQYLSPDITTQEWLIWIASWFDFEMIYLIPEERQRNLVHQLGWLFLRRGTRGGLERFLEIFFGVDVTIIEPRDQPCHFVVRIPLSNSDVEIERDVIERLIRSQAPAFASFTLEIS